MLRLEMVSTDERVTYVFRGRLTIYEVRQAYGVLRSQSPLVEKKPAYADLTQIQGFDISAVQLLLVWKRVMAAQGLPLRLLANEMVIDVLQLLGLGGLVDSSAEAY